MLLHCKLLGFETLNFVERFAVWNIHVFEVLVVVVGWAEGFWPAFCQLYFNLYESIYNVWKVSIFNIFPCQ